MQRVIEAFLISIIFMRKINGHGDEDFEKSNSKIQVIAYSQF
jgi:hypothetical protein